MKPFDDPSVASAFEAMPPQTRAGALALRDLILNTAESLPAANPLREELCAGASPPILPPKDQQSDWELTNPRI